MPRNSGKGFLDAKLCTDVYDERYERYEGNAHIQ